MPSEDLGYTSSEIPILLGWQETFEHGFYVGLELGPVVNRERATIAVGNQVLKETNSGVRAGGTLGVGFTQVFDFLDIGVCVFSPSIVYPDESSAFGIMFSLGVSVGL